MSTAYPDTAIDQDDPVHTAALAILKPSKVKDAGALADGLSQKHADMAREIRDLRQRLFEKTCELSEVKSRKGRGQSHEVDPGQIAEWFDDGHRDMALPINASTELQNFQALAPGWLIRLATSPKLSQMRWKEAMRKQPWKIGLWRALRRYQRRTR